MFGPLADACLKWSPNIKAILPSACVLYAKGQHEDGPPQREATVRQLWNTSHLFSRWRLPSHHYPSRHLGATCGRWAKAWRLHRRDVLSVAEKETETCPEDRKHTIAALWTSAVEHVIGLCLKRHVFLMLSASSWRHFHSVLSRTGTTHDLFFFLFINTSQDTVTTAMTVNNREALLFIFLLT